MKHHKLSSRKWLITPILFGTIIVGFAIAFINRHRFLEDIVELKAQERAYNDIKRLEVLERRQRQIEELNERRKQRGGSG